MLKVKVFSSFAASIALFTIGLSSERASAANLSNVSNPILPSQITTVANNLTVPYEIAVDNSDLVITTDGALARVNQSGDVSTIAPTTPGSPGGVVVLNNEYFVADYSSRSLLRISKDSNVTTLATNLGFPIGVAKQGNDLIVVDTGVPDAEEGQVGDARLLRVSLDGTVSVIASENLGAPIAVAVEGDNFWVTDYSLGRLLSVSSTGEVTPVATNLGQALDIELDGEDFIVTDFADGFRTPGNGRILRVDRSGNVETLLSGGNPSAMAIQGSDLLFSDVFQGTISRIPDVINPTSVSESSNIVGLLVVGAFNAIVLLKRRLKQSANSNLH